MLHIHPDISIMMTSLKFALYLICLCCWRIALTNKDRLASSVRQERRYVSANVGESVTLRCFLKGNVLAMVYWYKQSLGQKPRLVSSFYTKDSRSTLSEEFKKDSRFTLIANHSINHLEITNVLPSDSATYYCASSYAYNFHFAEGTTLSVKGSGWIVPALVHQERSFETLSCTVSTGSCEGEHRVYWIRNSEESEPGLIYTHGDRNNQCERKPDTETNSCVYNLPVESVSSSHAGTLYCAVVSCGHIVFGNGTELNFEDESSPVLVYLLSGALAFSIMLLVFLVSSTNMCPDDGTNSCQCTDSQDQASIVFIPKAERYKAAGCSSASQRDNTWSECVYFTVRP